MVVDIVILVKEPIRLVPGSTMSFKTKYKRKQHKYYFAHITSFHGYLATNYHLSRKLLSSLEWLFMVLLPESKIIYRRK